MTGTETALPSYNIRRWFWWWVTLCWELWVLYGFLLPAERGGGLYAPARPGVTEDSFARRYLWLRELGLLREELTMVDFGISNAERDWLTERGVTVCAPEKLAERMGEKTT